MTNAYTVELFPATELTRIRQSWDELASNAIEPNPFFESWFLQPALSHLRFDAVPSVVVCWYRDEKSNSATGTLTGLLPCQLSKRLRGIPMKVIEGLSHNYFSSGVPLLHADHAEATLHAILDWMNTGESPANLLVFPMLPANGNFCQTLFDIINVRDLVALYGTTFTRATFTRTVDPVAYYQRRFSGRARKQHRRQKELLAESGELVFRRLSASDSVEEWVTEFLELEGSGWKGELGTALAASQGDRSFFLEIAANAHKSDRFRMEFFELAGKPVAGRCVLVAGDGSYLFKIAYDERFAKYSPGALLEVECILSQAEAAPEWMDSCTAIDNPVYKRLWEGRRVITHISLSAGRWNSELVLSLLPMLRFGKRLIRSWRPRPASSPVASND